MGFVVGAEQKIPDILLFATRQRGQLIFQLRLEVEFLLQPDRHRSQKRSQSARGVGEIGFQQTLELQQRLIVKHHPLHVIQRNPGLIQTTAYRLCGKTGVVLDA